MGILNWEVEAFVGEYLNKSLNILHIKAEK